MNGFTLVMFFTSKCMALVIPLVKGAVHHVCTFTLFCEQWTIPIKEAANLLRNFLP